MAATPSTTRPMLRLPQHLSHGEGPAFPPPDVWANVATERTDALVIQASDPAARAVDSGAHRGPLPSDCTPAASIWDLLAPKYNPSARDAGGRGPGRGRYSAGRGGLGQTSPPGPLSTMWRGGSSARTGDEGLVRDGGLRRHPDHPCIRQILMQKKTHPCQGFECGQGQYISVKLPTPLPVGPLLPW